MVEMSNVDDEEFVASDFGMCKHNLMHSVSHLILISVTEADFREIIEKAKVEGTISGEVLQMTDVEAQLFVAGWLTHKVCMNLYF